MRGTTNSMILFLSISNIFGNAMTILSGLIVARWLLPEDLGLFNSFTVISSYIILIQLGIPSGLSRELPLHMGKQDESKAREYASVSLYWQLGLGLACLAILTIFAVYFLFAKNYVYAAGSFVIGITSLQTLYVTKYLKVLYRTNKDFNKLSQIKLISAVIAFASIIFVWKYGFYGLCIRAIVIASFDFYFTWKWKPLSVKPRWNTIHFKDLFIIGLPMYGVANVYALWPVIQKTLILSLGGTKSLGLFSLAIIVESSMNAITTSINSVVYPTMATQWGKGASVAELMTLLKKPMMIVIPLFTIMVFVGWWILPYFVEILLPNYMAGIYAAQWMLVVGFIEVFNVLANVYNVVRKQRDRLFSYLSGMVAWALSIIILYQVNGFALDIFPKAMLAGFIVMLFINLNHIRGYKKIRLNEFKID
jgi:O-antigen/teichoic acid export membrane protein